MAADAANDSAHHRRRLSGRDPLEEHRSATPLELLFDLTFVVAFGIAANEFAHYVAEGRVLSTAIPVTIYILAFYGLYASFTCHADPFHLSLLVGTAAVLVLSVVLAALGVSVAICLVVLMFAPLVTVVGYETLGHRHVQDALARMRV